MYDQKSYRAEQEEFTVARKAEVNGVLKKIDL